MQILIVGIGALGGTIAARAIRTGLPVRLAARRVPRPLVLLSLNEPTNQRLATHSWRRESAFHHHELLSARTAPRPPRSASAMSNGLPSAPNIVRWYHESRLQVNENFILELAG